MKSFEQIKATSVSEASAALAAKKEKARVYSGGTDLLGTLKAEIHPDYPETVISLQNIPGMEGIESVDGGLKIGALTKLDAIENDPAVLLLYPVLAQAAHDVASPQIRHMATIGGNICQEPRCWYYRYPDNKFDCMRKNGKLCNAMTGNNLYHSIFGAAKVCASPCEAQCPNNTPIPEYFEMVRQGDLDGAAALLLSKNPLAALVGRVCPHTCQTECNRNEFDESVSIHDVERFVGDHMIANADRLLGPIAADTGKKVAIIGAGPAGLTAAYFLRKQGHAVTVYDANEKAGGMLVYGIPAYRLPREAVAKTVAMIAGMGVVFKQNTVIGKDITLEALKKDYDAVLAGIGAWKSVGVGCPGDDAEGVTGGIDFLGKASRGEETGIAGKVVAVVGGGNTAMDACRTSLRLGAKKVYNFYRRTQAEMPAEEIEIEEAMEEGVEFLYLVAPAEIIKDGNRIKQVKLQKMELGEPDASGRRSPVPVAGAFEFVEVDVLISAIGQAVDPAGLEGLETNKKNWIVADLVTKQTNDEKVFAAGDGAIGPKTAIEAIADAKMAAAAISRYLGYEIPQEEPRRGQRLSFDQACLAESEPIAMAVKPVADRTFDGEDIADANLAAVTAETKRCYNCGCVAVSPSDIAPALIALDARIVTTERTIPAADFFSAGVCSSTVLKDGEIVTEILLSEEKAGKVQAYRKFRTRKTIDFPIAGLASNLILADGKIQSAKLIFSGMAPVPYEFAEVEAFLEGKEPTAQLAEEAARLALRHASPLKENAFKAQLVRAFIRRAVAEA